MVFDLSYFIVYGIMLLNTIVALIVDSFSSQRREGEARKANRQTESFISCLDRKLIEMATQAQGIRDGFYYHEEKRQPKWGYMAFIFYLREKKPQDYTGPEQKIISLITTEDIKWIPIGRSKLLEENENVILDDAPARLEKQGLALKEDIQQGTRTKHLLLTAIGNMDRTSREQMEALQARVSELQHINKTKDPDKGSKVSVRWQAGMEDIMRLQSS